MLRQKIHRNFKHNLLLAILFSTVAGMINVVGLLIFNVFTTNLTGHVGEFASSIHEQNWNSLFKVLVWILAFLFGAFSASFLTNILGRTYPRISYVIPVLIEILCLLIVVFPNLPFDAPSEDQFKLLLLFFSMGLQNGIVSVVSGNVVRTTHLTGMVTDFGIGLSELLIRSEEKEKAKEIVLLAGTIICSFLVGGILGAYFTPLLLLNSLYIPITILLFVISFDFLRTKYLLLKNRLIEQKFVVRS